MRLVNTYKFYSMPYSIRMKYLNHGITANYQSIDRNSLKVSPNRANEITYAILKGEYILRNKNETC
ncbi:hypothetical protein [Vibrio phage BUCT194]|uniref:Uncharacterized protein n=1 Tax=Vibrio phage BUCT194 TaxID=2859072 RepID=A0AAE9BQ04_9CAUD|nr:hypothetical protein PP741_gp050 [Vibrio phage BUCT194]UAW01175.1 hypothetical protein [Vibrio phage BUCT194]